MALWRRDRAGTPAGPGLVHHSDAGSQTTSSAFTAQLLDAGIDASIGTVGDVLDNALMESQIGLYKTELIKPRKPWHGLADIELATAERVDWFNNQRLHTAIGDIPPHEHEHQLLRSISAPTGGWSQRIEPPPIPERFSNVGGVVVDTHGQHP